MKTDNIFEILNKIQSLIERNQLSFLIGAGFSKNINKTAFLSWKELLEDAIWEKHGTGRDADRVRKGKAVYEKVLRDKSLLSIASEVVSGAGYHEAIDDYIESHTPYMALSGDKPVLMKDGVEMHGEVHPECHMLLRQLDVRNIYTFNYDNALEFFLGDRDGLRKRRETLTRERMKDVEALREIDEKLHLLRTRPTSEPSLGERSQFVSSSEDGDIKVKDAKKEEEDLNTRRQELLSAISEKNQISAQIDKEIENAYLVVKNSSDIALTSDGYNIYKIHGNLRLPDEPQYGFDGDRHAQYIITKEDYDTYEAKHAAFVNLMRIDLLRNRFCIVGVSGSDANFLAWVNWVKDVLDKAGDDDSAEKYSFFIHAGENDLSREMKQMLKNHFIIPVILKNAFPKASNESERVKALLEYIQPNNTIKTEKLSKLWGGIDRHGLGWKKRKGIPDAKNLEDLCRLSSTIFFHKAVSPIHNAAKDIQLFPSWLLRDGKDLAHYKVFSAAIRCSLLPVTGAYQMKNLSVLGKSRSKYVKETYQYARRRHFLLSDPKALNSVLIGDDDYTRLMKGLFLFDFPQSADCHIKCEAGLDYVRLFSLQMLVSGTSDVKLENAARLFSSPQELVLASDWLLWLDQTSKSSLHSLAKQYVRKYTVYHLSDYIQSYLKEMREKKDVSSYGNIVEIIYLDGWHAGFENAAVLLNSLLELGVTFAGRNVLTDDDWVSVAKELKSYYPYPVAFYTIARNSKESVTRRIAQEMMYDNASYTVLPDLLKRMIRSLTSGKTPELLLAPIARFAKELFIAVPVKEWEKVFIRAVEDCLDLALNKTNYLNSKALYQFIAEGAEYISHKPTKLRILVFVLDNLSEDSKYDNQLNALAIAAGRGLTVNDFEPLAEKLVKYAEKNVRRIESYVLINLSDLLSKERQRSIYGALEKQSLSDTNLIEAYSYLIRDEGDIATAFKQKMITRKDIWQSGAGDDRIIVGDGFVRISRIDGVLHFDHDQVIIIYEDLKKELAKMKRALGDPKHEAKDTGWMSRENNFREVVIDMMFFIHRREHDLEQQGDLESTISDLYYVYGKCVFGKTILEMLADDKIHRAIRSMMTQTELKGIQTLNPEYETLLGIILTRNSRDVGVCFQHVGWAIREYEDFFNTKTFNVILTSILDGYAQYFKTENPRQWDVRGCQKEVAEKYLCLIAETLSQHGHDHSFWDTYKKKFYLK